LTRVRWGVLSTADIGVTKVIPAIQQGRNCTLAAISSRSLERSREAAERLQIPKAYGSYEALLADPEIDAIYNPLPNHLHVPWSIMALEAGKHVLCEKPIGLSADEGRQLVEAGARHPRLKLMEAFMYRHHPQWQRVRQLLGDGALGRLCTIQSAFSYSNRDPGNIRNQPDIGGGGLMDIGCYSISLSRFLFAAEPVRVSGIVEQDPEFQVDRMASAILDFGVGTSTFTCGTQLSSFQRANICGDRGRIEIEIPFTPPPDRPCRAWWLPAGGAGEEIVFEPCNQYTIQAEHFARAIIEDTPVPTPIDDAVANMKVIEAILRSAESGAFEPV
jgi:predicted dehydrogenase